MQALRFLTVFTLVAFATTGANAQALKENDPKRPAAAIAADLDVAPEQFAACFSNVRPAPQGTRPTRARGRANKKILLPCLQEASPDITNARLDAEMGKYRP